MGGIPEVFPEIRRLFLFAAHHDVHVDFIWKPRNAPEMLVADELSRMEDSSEIFLTRKTFLHIVFRRRGDASWGFPTLDVFAGAAMGQHIRLTSFTPSSVVLALQG